MLDHLLLKFRIQGDAAERTKPNLPGDRERAASVAHRVSNCPTAGRTPDEEYQVQRAGKENYEAWDGNNQPRRSSGPGPQEHSQGKQREARIRYETRLALSSGNE